MQRHLSILLPSIVLLIIACSDSKFPISVQDNHLSFDGHQFEIESVYCSDRMGRVTVRFEQGALYVSDRDEPPGYKAMLRLTSPDRSEYVNQELTHTSSDLVRTKGLSLDLDRGIHGEIRLMRTISLLNSEHFPDAVPITMQVRATCPK